MKFAFSHYDRDVDKHVSNVTKISFSQGTALLVVLAAAVGVYLSKQGIFGFVLTGIPLWCFGVVASTGGIVFFLGPMLFGWDPPPSRGHENGGTALSLPSPLLNSMQGVSCN